MSVDLLLTPGTSEASLVEAILMLLQRGGDWPTLDELDKYADRQLGIVDATRVLQRLPHEVAPGLSSMLQIPDEHRIRLSVRAVSLCEDGSKLAAAFGRAVGVAARLEEARIDGDLPAELTPDVIASSLPATGRDGLLRQLGRVLAVEDWGWSSAGTDYPWRFVINRKVRRFRGVDSVESYLQRANPACGSSDMNDAVPTPVERPSSRRPEEVDEPTLRSQLPILDPDEPGHELRWPRSIVHSELRRLTRQLARRSSDDRSAQSHVDRFLRFGFAGGDLARQFDMLLGRLDDPWADRVVTDQVLAWLEQLSVELIGWNDPPDRPLFYSQRHRPVAHQPTARPETCERLADLIEALAGEGMFAEGLGLWCPDDFDQPEPASLFGEVLGHHIDGFLWPPKANSMVEWDDDDLFDTIEALHHIASWPGIWNSHDYGGCPGHPSSFSRPLGQALVRWRINAVLDDSLLGVRLADSGEDRGRIIRSVGESASIVIEAALAAPLGNDASEVEHAIATFRGRRQSPEALRNAIVDLAGVLERHRKILKMELLRRDEGALFEIANKFDLRHRDANQRGDYDLHFSEWIFQWYLATVTLTKRIVDRQTLARHEEDRLSSQQIVDRSYHV